MEFINKNLLLSLKQDLKTLNTISSEILKNLDSFELSSWLFPTKSYKEVSEINLTITPDNRQYLLLLELMIERLYLIINQLTKYIENCPNTPKRQQNPKNVVKPNNISLGASTRLLWQQIQLLEDSTQIKLSKSVSAERNPQEEKALDDKDTQTNIFDPNICNSCSTATSCIKELTDELIISIEAVALKKARGELHEDIYNITQYGSMHRLTTAIEEDIRSFLKRLKNLEIQNKRYVKELKKIKAKYTQSLRMIKTVGSSYQKTKKLFLNAKQRNGNLLKRINELEHLDSENKNNLQREKEKIQCLEKSVEASTLSLTLISTDNENLHKDLVRVMSESLNSLSERDTWKKRFSEIYLENRHLKTELDKLRSEIIVVKNNIHTISSHYEQLSEKLETTNVKIDEKTKMFENLIKTAVEVESNKIRNTDTVATFNNSFIPNIRVKGDPVTDMKQQVEANLYSIKKLEQYNTDLLRTIHRIQEKTISS